jgi:hypothetical protein
MGRLADARAIMARLRVMTAAETADANFLRNAQQRELLLSGLHLAAAEAD